MRFILFFLALTLLSGCAATYKNTPLTKVNSKLERSFPVLIATPANGHFGATVYATQSQIFRYIEDFYNRRRRHSSIVYQAPEEYERLFIKIAV
jgi:transposase InsO family protein